MYEDNKSRKVTRKTTRKSQNDLQKVENNIKPVEIDLKNDNESKVEPPNPENNNNNDINNNNDDLLLENPQNSSKINEYLDKMGLNNSQTLQIDEKKLKVYQKILENDDFNQNLDGNFETFDQDYLRNQRSQHTYSLSPMRRLKNTYSKPDDQFMREKIHELTLQSMKYRHQLESQKIQIGELEQTIEHQNYIITKLEKEKENSNKYLLKLENLLNNATNQGAENNFNASFTGGFGFSAGAALGIMTTMNQSTERLASPIPRQSAFSLTTKSFISNRNTLNFNGNGNQTNNPKRNLKEVVSNLLNENIKLRNFQNQILEISKNYDDINENILEGIKNIQIHLNNNNNNNEEEFSGDLEKLVKNLEEILQVKNKEYNVILNSKNDIIEVMNDELRNMKKEIENLKLDRIKDQKIITELESEKEILNVRLESVSQLKKMPKMTSENVIFVLNLEKSKL